MITTDRIPPNSPPYKQRGILFKHIHWTACKETIVSHLISRKTDSFDIFLQNSLVDSYTKQQIESIESYMNHKSKKLGFKNIKIAQYTMQAPHSYMDTVGKLFRITFDSRWMKNSVLGTMFMTFLRRKMYLVKKLSFKQDELHLKTSKWLIRQLYDGKKELFLYGGTAYSYDIGFVQLGHRLANRNYYSIVGRYSNFGDRHRDSQKNRYMFQRKQKLFL